MGNFDEVFGDLQGFGMENVKHEEQVVLDGEREREGEVLG